jgi:hypothetical protein
MKNFTLIIVSCILAATMQAQILRVPAQYMTIQEGINAANPGDTVLVADGTYLEQINFLGKKPLMVASHFIIDGNTNHIDSTIITKTQFPIEDSASIVYFVTGEDTTSVLCGFTITGGKGTFTAGISDDLKGGGIWIYNSGARIRNNIIRNNTVNDTLRENSNGTYGAGISTVDSSGSSWVIIENNEICGNTSISNHYISTGGGIYSLNNTRIYDNIISNNECLGLGDSTDTFGGGIACFTPHNPYLTAIVISNQITDNTVVPLEYYGYGGGFGSEYTLLKFEKNTVSGNKQTNSISGQSYGGGFYCYSIQPGSTISNNYFSYNVIANGWGGAILIGGIMNWQVVENNYFFHNSARLGGAFYSYYCNMILQNNVFYKNHCTLTGGAAFFNGEDPSNMHSACIINNSFSKNSASAGGAIFTNLVNPIILNSVFWQDSASIGAEIKGNNPLTEIAYCNIDTNLVINPMELIIGDGIINEDPLFTDTLLHPSMISPGIDEGIDHYTCHYNTWNAPMYDIENTPRPWYQAFDMGAYEYYSVGVRESSGVSRQSSVVCYPNPTGGIVNCQLFIVDFQRVTLKVFDIHGREVAVVLDECLAAGTHQGQWDASGLPSGIYFYRLTVSGQRSAVSGKILKF